MARENMEEWGTSSDIEAETVRSTVQAFADGGIEFEDVPAKTNKSNIRDAPSFLTGDDVGVPLHHQYTMQQVATFLGWTNGKDNIPNAACRVAFATLEAEERNLINKKKPARIEPKPSKANYRRGTAGVPQG